MIEQLSKHSSDAEARRIIKSVALCAGFRSLDENQQQQLLKKIGGAEPIFAGSVRQKINDESLFRVVLQAYLPERQAEALKGLLEKHYPTSGVDNFTTLLDDSKSSYRIFGPSTTYLHKFVGGQSLTARKYEIALQDRRVPVFVSPELDKNGRKTLSIEQIAQGLSNLPKASLDLIKSINLEGEANPHDAHFAEEYKTGSFKSIP